LSKRNLYLIENRLNKHDKKKIYLLYKESRRRLKKDLITEYITLVKLDVNDTVNESKREKRGTENKGYTKKRETCSRRTSQEWK